MEDNKQTFEFGIKEIKTLSFSINEDSSPSGIKDVGIGFGLDFWFDIKKSEVSLAISVRFNRKSDGSSFMNGKVKTVFIVKKISEYSIQDNAEALNFPEGVMETLFSISYTHTRACISQLSNGSIYDQYVIPVIQPKRLLDDLLKNE